MNDSYFKHLSKRKDIFKKERSHQVLIVIISLFFAIIVGIWISSQEIYEISADFFEKMPEERVAKIVKCLPESVYDGKREREVVYPSKIKPLKRKSAEGSTGGGGDPRARVTKKGILGIVTGKTVASSELLGGAGYTADIDAVLTGVAGLKRGSDNSLGRKGESALGFGSQTAHNESSGNVDNLMGILMGKETCATNTVQYRPKSFHAKQPVTISENSFVNVEDESISTFSIDVDKASYSNIRSYILANQLPPANSVRIEEMINYFNYDYPYPKGKAPFSIISEVADCPWNRENRLVHIGIKGRKITIDIPVSNFVFLIDVSGSMSQMNKLPLIKKSLKMLVENLNRNDRIAIISYAGKAGTILNSTSCKRKDIILNAIDNLTSEGSTAGNDGLKLAYQIASENFLEDGNNRVLLATDGDFNIGESSRQELSNLIKSRKLQDIFLTVLGFGIESEKDTVMEKLAHDGDGNYAIIDDIFEAKKVLIEESKGTFFLVGKDVKIQVEFNSDYVKSYRLIGYENRLLDKEDFANDKVDAGDLGAEQNVTALYEIVPKYEKGSVVIKTNCDEKDLLTLRLRYKDNSYSASKLIERKIIDSGKTLEMASYDFKFSSSVAAFGMLLQNSKYLGNSTYRNMLNLAQTGIKGSSDKSKHEFLFLVQKCMELKNRNDNISFTQSGF